MRQDVTAVLVPSLLHEDVQVRTAAASLAFNVAAVLQKPRVEAVRIGRRLDEPDDVGIGRWRRLVLLWKLWIEKRIMRKLVSLSFLSLMLFEIMFAF
jgi:hypothetical protein